MKLERIMAEVRQHPGRAASAVADYFTGYRLWRNPGIAKEFFRDPIIAPWGSLASLVITGSELLNVASHPDPKRAMLAVAVYESVRPILRAVLYSIRRISGQ